MTAQSTITLSALDGNPAVRHAFFTRQGGVSGGLFASLNCGFGSGDNLDDVARNRAIAAATLDLVPEQLVSCHQIHGTNVITVERPWRREDNPRADGTVHDAILENYVVPSVISERERLYLSASVLAWIGPGGQILKHEFQKKSGNAFFDQALELAIQRTKLPPPPAEIAKSLRDTGVVLNFKP